MDKSFECWAIIGIVAAISFIFLRKGNKGYALSILPLIAVPLFHLIGNPLSHGLNFLPASRYTIRVTIDILALIAACISFGVFAGKFYSKRNRVVYIGTCGIFTLILSLILILNIK